MNSGIWEVLVDSFWTYPCVYSELKKVDPQLYSGLAEAKLVIFKGDLNYRKLVGDINWETTVNFKTSLQVLLAGVVGWLINIHPLDRYIL